MYPNNFGYGVTQPYPQYQQPIYGQVQAPMMQPQHTYSTTGFNRQQPQTQAINGRIISNLNEIMPEEVPMNRQYSFFPLADGSCIYAKMWDGDGNLNTYKYVLDKQDTIDVEPSKETNFVNDVLDRLESIEKTIASSTIKPKYNQQRQNSSKQTKETDNA